MVLSPMIRLLATASRIAQQVGVEPHAVDHPQSIDQLTEGERRIVLGLQKDDVLAIVDPPRPACLVQLLGRAGRRHPHLDDGDRGDEGGDQTGGGGERVVHVAAPEVAPEIAPEVLDQLPRRLREEAPERPDRSFDAFLRPQVEKRGRVRDAPQAIPALALGRDQAFSLKAGQDAVRQAQRGPCLLGKILDLPAAARIQQQRLSDEPRLAAEPRRPRLPRASMPFEMKEQPRQLDMRVPETIADRDPMRAKDRSRLRRGLAGNEQERSARGGLGRVHELPGCGRIGALPGLNGKLDSAPGGILRSRRCGDGQNRGAVTGSFAESMPSRSALATVRSPLASRVTVQMVS